jgi:hypothetical protein
LEFFVDFQIEHQIAGAFEANGGGGFDGDVTEYHFEGLSPGTVWQAGFEPCFLVFFEDVFGGEFDPFGFYAASFEFVGSEVFDVALNPGENLFAAGFFGTEECR